MAWCQQIACWWIAIWYQFIKIVKCAGVEGKDTYAIDSSIDSDGSTVQSRSDPQIVLELEGHNSHTDTQNLVDKRKSATSPGSQEQFNLITKQIPKRPVNIGKFGFSVTGVVFLHEFIKLIIEKMISRRPKLEKERNNNEKRETDYRQREAQYPQDHPSGVYSTPEIVG